MFEKYINTEDFVKLPNSSYSINSNGIVIDSSGNKVNPSLDKLGNEVYNIDWYEGKKEYSKSLLLCHAFKPTNVPVKFWGKLNVLHKDGNATNYGLSNLIWKFPIGLGAEDNDGFAYIPMYSNYIMNKNGELYDTKRKKSIKCYYTGGYVRYSLDPDFGGRTTASRHRLLAYVWLDYPANIDDMEVNHINGIKGNDSLDNLEITTPKENNNHSVRSGLTIGMRVKVFDTDTGVESMHMSMSNFYRSFRNIRHVIDSYVSKGIFKFTYKHLDIEVDVSKIAGADVNEIRPILVKNIETGEVTEYGTMRECMEYFKTTYFLLTRRIQSDGQRVYDSKHLFKLKTSLAEWADPSLIEADTISRERNRSVLVHNVKTGVVTRFNTIADCAAHFNVTVDTINWRVRSKGQRVFSDYNQYKLTTDATEFAKVDNIELSILADEWKKGVLTRNVLTNEVLEFETMRECSEYHGVHENTIVAWLKRPEQIMFPGYLQIKFKTDPSEWRHVEDPQAVLDSYGTTIPILVKDANVGTVKEYVSSRDCSRELGVKPTTLSYRLQSDGQKIYPPGYMFKFKNSQSAWLK